MPNFCIKFGGKSFELIIPQINLGEKFALNLGEKLAFNFALNLTF